MAAWKPVNQHGHGAFSFSTPLTHLEDVAFGDAFDLGDRWKGMVEDTKLHYTLPKNPKTNIAGENWWLEDKPFILGSTIFSGATLSFREGKYPTNTNDWTLKMIVSNRNLLVLIHFQVPAVSLQECSWTMRLLYAVPAYGKFLQWAYTNHTSRGNSKPSIATFLGGDVAVQNDAPKNEQQKKPENQPILKRKIIWSSMTLASSH